MMRLFSIMDELETVVAAARVGVRHDLVSSQIDVTFEFLFLRRA